MMARKADAGIVLGTALALVACGSQPAKPPSASVQQLTCRQEVTEAAIFPKVPIRPRPGDLVVGALSFPDGRRLAHEQPRDLQPGGRLVGSYKIPPVLGPGARVTIAIAPRARRYVVLHNPSAPRRGVVAVTYHACAHAWGFFPQTFTFTDGRLRGCVPMDITAQGGPTRRVVLSLFAGACMA